MRKDWAKALQAQYDISVVLSCIITGMSRTAFYYQPKRCDDSEVITVLNTLVESIAIYSLRASQIFISDIKMKTMDYSK